MVCEAQDYRFKYYGREDGLPPTVIEDIRRCNDGYLWIACWSGVYRFDGKEFSRFTSGLMPYNERFRRIELDESNSLLYALRHDGQLMTLARQDNNLRQCMTGRQFSEMYRLAGGEILFAADDGSIYTGSGATPDENASWNLVPYYTPDRPGRVNDIFTDNNGNKYILYDRGTVRNREFISSAPAFCHLQTGNIIYIGSSDGNILIIDEKGETEFHHTGIASDITLLSNIPAEYGFLIATSDNSLYNFSFEGGASQIEAPFSGDGSFRCSKSADGELWLYSKGGSLNRYDQSSRKFVAFHNPDRREWDYENRLSAFYCDPQNIVWMAGSLRGLEKAYRQNNPFKIIQISSAQGPTIGNSVRSLYRSTEGLNFVGTRDGRIHIYNENLDDEVVRWRVSGTVLSMAQDHEGRMWFGTDGNGVVENTARADYFPIFHATYHHNQPGYYSANADHIHSLWLAPDKRLWSGSIDGGLSYIDLNGGERRFVSSKNILNCPSDLAGGIRYVCMSPDGSTLYAAGTAGIIYCTNPHAEPDKMNFRRLDKFNGLDIQHIMLSGSGLMYASSYGSGIFCLDPLGHGEDMENYTLEDGLPSNYVLSSIEDSAGNIWIVTDVGLCRLDPASGNITVFSADRIRSNTLLNEGAPIKCSDGRICIGTNSGILVFDPAAVSNSTYSPKLMVTAFYLNGMLTPFDEGELPRLHPDDRISLTLKAIDMRIPERVAYSYKLAPAGAEGEWVSLGTGDRVSIDHLSPGKYRLSLRSTNADGFQAGNDIEFGFAVRRSAAWFIMIAALAAVLGGATALWLRLRRRDGQHLRHTDGSDSFAVKFMKLIEDNIDNSEFGLDEICSAMGMSRSTLYKRCRDSFGNTPSACLTELRLIRASELLRDSDQSISQIAYACGFNDPHYFSRAFKRRFGCTASEYRIA